MKSDFTTEKYRSFLVHLKNINFPIYTLNDWIKDPLNEDYVYSLTESVKKNCYKLSEKEEQLISKEIA